MKKKIYAKFLIQKQNKKISFLFWTIKKLNRIDQQTVSITESVSMHDWCYCLRMSVGMKSIS
jgi:hypothetical protein